MAMGNRYRQSFVAGQFPTAKGALRRVKATGLYFYHQTDPRGAALYVANVPLNNQNYSSIGVCCAV